MVQFELDPALQEEEDTLVEAFRLRLEAATHAVRGAVGNPNGPYFALPFLTEIAGEGPH